MNRGWSVKIGTPKEIERERIERVKRLTVQERLDEYCQLMKEWHGDRRLERVYRFAPRKGR